MPGPGGADYVVELGVAGFPAEIADGFFGAGDEDSGVAGATGMDLRGDGMAGDPTGRFNYLADAEALAIAEIEHEAVFGGLLGLERAEGEQVGIGEIGDVDVVANAGAVGGGGVIAINADGRTAAKGNIENQWDEMGLA